MLGMPVATLRVWERRYGVAQPALSPSGQRLYSAADVGRLALVKQLTDRGHAIGSLARLDMAQLRQVASTHARSLATTQTTALVASVAPVPAQAWRLAVVGVALGERLQRPALLRRLGRPVELVGPFDSAVQAAGALQGVPVDAVVLHAPQLQADSLEAIVAAAPAWAGVPKAVLYGFAADPVCEALASAGTALLREPQPDAVLAQWLRGLASAGAAPAPRAARAAGSTEPAARRRWDDAALAHFAGLSSTIACECPRHLAELLMQLAHFEEYSAACAHRSPADAQIHAHLHEVAAAARAGFETALEHVALHEGLLLPSPLRAATPMRPRRQP